MLLECRASFSNIDVVQPTTLSKPTMPFAKGEVGLPTQQLPASFALHPSYPNPFNPTTTITYDLPEDAHVSLVVYDVLGRNVAELVNATEQAGYHAATWNAASVASGVYLARFTATDATGAVKLAQVMKLVVMR